MKNSLKKDIKTFAIACAVSAAIFFPAAAMYQNLTTVSESDCVVHANGAYLSKTLMVKANIEGLNAQRVCTALAIAEMRKSNDKFKTHRILGLKLGLLALEREILN